MKHVFNLHRDAPDSRDRVMLHRPLTLSLPKQVDMRPSMPPVYDQGETSSCTGNAIAAALDCMHKRDNPSSDFFAPSRLFIYYNERVLGGNVEEDNGAQIRDGIRSVNADGACKETTWPFDPLRLKTKPTPEAYVEAEKYQAVSYQRVPLTLDMLRSTLAAGIPIVAGIAVYASLESETVAKTGMATMPDCRREQMLGGHAVVICGYRDDWKTFLVRNSWSANWGDGGYFHLPYDYVVNPGLTWDAWAITKAE